MKIKITVDSTADLTSELCEKYDITVIPLCVNLDEEVYFDGVNITPDMIYKYVTKNKKLPKTSAVNSEKYREEFTKIFADGYDAIIHFNLSSEMSITHQNAKMLLEDFKNLFVIDSQTLSTATALQALYACELAKQEKYTAEEIVAKIEARKQYAQASFVLDKLEYLYRGGRCNALVLFGANLLKIKPSIEVHDGKMGVGKKYFGKFENCVEKYVRDILEKYPNPDTTRVFVTHTKIDNKIVDLVKDYLKQNSKFEEIIETTAGSTITSHCGSNTIGVLFYTDGENK